MSSAADARTVGPVHGRNLDYMVADSAVDPDGIVTRVLRVAAPAEDVALSLEDGTPLILAAQPGAESGDASVV